MNSSNNKYLTTNDITEYKNNGAICVRNVFGEEDIEILRREVERVLQNPGPYGKEFGDADGARFFGEIFVTAYNSVIKSILINSPLGEIAGHLMESDRVQFFFDHLLVKEAGATQPTPWHQDAPYFAMNGFQCCGIWIALDDVSSVNGAVQYLKGTHKGDTMYAPRSFAKGDNYSDDLTPIPDIDSDLASYNIAEWELKPGDCTIHHVRTLHGAKGNKTPHDRRRGLATRWVGDDATFGLRSGIPDDMLQAFRDLVPELEIEQSFDHPIFPVVWKK
tara:strand:- start:274 stop:1101 length:828 start_codon:yes stop_codon:yes gene_type:complete